MSWRRLVLTAIVLLAGCRKDSSSRPFRLGYFPNLTHAQALVGDREGRFAAALGPRRFESKRFNAGPSEIEALFAGELDAGYIGSGPAINAYVRSHGSLRIIAGSASGGAALITRNAKSARDLRGRKLATPQLGNTQDIALRHWLHANGLKPSGAGGGDVTVIPIPNADILSLFMRREIEGAWVPEPWAARMVAEGGGHVLVDERDLWEDGQFATTVLIASTRALQSRRPELEALLRAHVQLTRQAQSDELGFARRANDAFGQLTRFSLEDRVLADAVSRVEFTVDPLEEQLAIAARHAAQLGFIPNADVKGLVDRELLERILREAGPAREPPPNVGGSGR